MKSKDGRRKKMNALMSDKVVDFNSKLNKKKKKEIKLNPFHLQSEEYQKSSMKAIEDDEGDIWGRS